MIDAVTLASFLEIIKGLSLMVSHWVVESQLWIVILLEKEFSNKVSNVIQSTLQSPPLHDPFHVQSPEHGQDSQQERERGKHHF